MIGKTPDLTGAEQRVRDYIRTLLAEIVRLNDVLAETTATRRATDRMSTCPHGRTGHCEECPNHHNTRE